MPKYIVSQPAIALCIESRSSRSPTTTSAPMSRNPCARSSSVRTIARTALPCFTSIAAGPSTHLKWNTFVTPSIPVVAPDVAPGEATRPWPPISSTLIYGVRDAVLVDCFITEEQARAQADWIASTGKNLTTIFATHGHGDHCFGASVILERFPNAHFVASPGAIQVMRQQTV